PESHAISFAILAYGSAYLKVHRGPEFYASLLNNQPMGFYMPATIVKDAQRHGIHMLPVCARESRWVCTVVSNDTVRLGFCVVNGMRKEHGEALVKEREFAGFDSLDDFKRRVMLSKEELRTLAELGALNCFADHRRAAMWKVEETQYDDLLGSAHVSGVVNGVSPSRTFSERSFWRDAKTNPRDACAPQSSESPLLPMSMPERVKADYTAMNLTTGPHPMKLLRAQLPDIWRASDLRSARHGATVQIAGNVICRQRPGTAKGFVFVSLEDETGVSNAIVTPDLFERMRLLLTEEPFLIIEGRVQNTDNVVLIKAEKIRPLDHEQLIGSESHDFH
ncbi:MAG: OB-fold nucleic acid binding domain-containing protein, partial [Chthoniobacterales bacterium]